MGFHINNGVLILCTQEPEVTEVVIPDGVTEIGESAFLLQFTRKHYNPKQRDENR